MKSLPLRLFLVCFILAPLTGAQNALISEFLALNDDVLLDEDGDSSDWIEIYNPAGVPLSLFGWKLTDQQGAGTWTFPAVNVPAQGYLVVFASGKDRRLAGSELHTDFQLSANGEYLGLLRGDSTVAHEYAPYPLQVEDISYGFGVPSATLGHLDVPTPGTENGESKTLVLPVDFSTPRGFYDTSFSVVLTTPTPDTFTVYTLDGSEPSQSNGTVYTGPIPIGQTSFVRAIAFANQGGSISQSVTSTYIFPQDVLAQSDAGAIAAGFPAEWRQDDGTRWTLGGARPGAWYGLDTTVAGLYTSQELIDSLKAIPSVSLVMSTDDWFGYDPGSGTFGIYPNSQKDWDRAGSAELIDPNGGAEFQVNVGFGIQGGSSTNITNRSQLSIAMKFQAQFGPKKLAFPLFEGSPVDKFDYVLLDAGNQGSIHAAVNVSTKEHAQGLRDQFMMNLQREMGHTSPYGTHAHVYINGLYWGVYNMHERPDENWASAHFGGDSEQFDWVKEGAVLAGNGNSVTHPTPGAWDVVADIEAGGLGDGAMYNGMPAYDALQEYLDLTSYVDYMLLNFYGGNTDWPQRNWMATSDSRLSAVFGDRNPEGRFRFHTWDAEQTLPWEGVTSIGGFFDRTTVNGQNGANAAFLYTELQNNSEFPLFIADRYQKHASPDGALYVDPAFSSAGTPYDPSFPERNRPATLYDELVQKNQQALIMEYARWANYFHSPGDVDPSDWADERDRILEDFMPIRTDVLRDQLQDKGLYPNVDPPALSQHGGLVPPGFSLTITQPLSVNRYYTTDGSDPRLAGGAISPSATLYSGPIPLVVQTRVRVRAFTGSEWSALVEADFLVSGLLITEVMPDNDMTFTDELGQFEDYIEILNSGTTTLDMGGMYLTDNLSIPTMWEVPAGTLIDPGERLLFWADEDLLDGPLHTNFKLSKFGEDIGLFSDDASGNLLIDGFAFGPVLQDDSIGRLPDTSSELFTLVTPSPTLTNIPPDGTTYVYDARDPALNPLSLSVVGTPRLGMNFTLNVNGASPTAAGLVGVGSTTVDAALKTGRLISNANILTMGFMTDGTGGASLPLSFPNDPSLVGITGYLQVFVAGELSNGLAMTGGF